MGTPQQIARTAPAAGFLIALAGLPGLAVAQTDSDQAAQPQEEEFSLQSELAGRQETLDADRSLWDMLGENLRVSVDLVSRVDISRLRGEFAFLNAAGLDIHKVFSDEQGDIGTLLLQPYVVRRDNQFARPIEFDGDDAFVIELHDFYFNLTRWGRGRTNFKIGHFDVPFGLEPQIDTHFTLHQFTPLHDAGFKKDWGFSLNGAFPEFDYEVSLTQGTGMDLSGRNLDPYLVAGRIGTPSNENFVLGLSALYGEVIDNHGTHRVDDGDPLDTRQPGRFVRRLRVGADVTKVFEQFTLLGQVSGGRDFDQEVFNTIVEVNWTSPDEKLTAYLQALYLGQDGHFGWDEDVQTRLGVVWKFHHEWSLSGEWRHDYLRYLEETAGLHRNDDTWSLQLRWTF